MGVQVPQGQLYYFIKELLTHLFHNALAEFGAEKPLNQLPAL